MSAIHKKTAEQGWARLSLAEKMGNIGAEISRARSADERNDRDRRNTSLERASELVQLTVRGLNTARKRELERMQEVIENAKNGSTDVRLKSIEQYCMPFAILARKNV